MFRVEQLGIGGGGGPEQVQSSQGFAALGPLRQLQLHRQHDHVLRLQPEKLSVQETQPGWEIQNLAELKDLSEAKSE